VVTDFIQETIEQAKGREMIGIFSGHGGRWSTDAFKEISKTFVHSTKTSPVMGLIINKSQELRFLSEILFHL